MRKNMYCVLCFALLLFMYPNPVHATSYEQEVTIQINVLQPGGESYSCVDEQGGVLEVEISAVEEPVSRSTETLSVGTWTRKASYKYTPQNSSSYFETSFYFKTVISASDYPKFTSVYNIVRHNVASYSGPTIRRSQATASLPAYIYASGTSNTIANHIVHAEFQVTCDKNDLLTIYITNNVE